MFQPVEIFGKQLGDDGANVATESRKLTLADLFVLTTGFAIALVLPRVFEFGAALYLLGMPMWFFIVISVLRFILWFNFAITCVIVVRRFRFGSMPRPAEWLSILLTLWMLTEMIPNVDHVVNEIYRFTNSSHDFAFWRWRIAGAVFVFLITVLLFLSMYQRLFPAWLRIFALGALGVTLLWGPLAVLEIQFSSLFPPLTVLGDGWLLRMTVATLQTLARFPCSLFIGVPAMATYFTWRRGGRRRWAWTDRFAARIASLLGILVLLNYYFGSYESPPMGWISARIVTSVGLVITCFLSARLLRYSSVLTPADSHMAHQVL